MFKTIATFAAVAMLSVNAAQALTFKTGQVYSSEHGGVVDATETKTGQAALANDGYHIAGGVIYVAIGDTGEVAAVELKDLQGKSKDEIADIIGEAVTDKLIDTYDAVEADVAAIAAEAGIDEDAVYNAAGKSVEEIVEHIKNSDDVTGAIAGVSETVGQAVADELVNNSTSCDAGGCYNDTVHPGDVHADAEHLN